MSNAHNLTADLAHWEHIAAMDDCISVGRFAPSDIRAMLARIKAAEDALTKIAQSRVLGMPDEISRAQIEALIDMAKDALPRDGKPHGQDFDIIDGFPVLRVSDG